MKSAKEKMQDYRKRIKRDEDKYKVYLKKERERFQKRKQAGKIKTLKDMTPEEKSDYQKKRKKRNITHREKKKQDKKNLAPAEANKENVVKESLSNKKEVDRRVMAGKTKRRKYTEKLKKKIQDLNQKLNRARKTIKCLRKKVSRLEDKLLGTPEKKVKEILKGETVNSEVKKKLIFAEAIQDQIKENIKLEKKRSTKRDFGRIISGRILKKYKFCGLLKKMASKRIFEKKKETGLRNAKKNFLEASVRNFLEDDENSTCCPGSKDTVTKHKEKRTKRILTGTLKDLHKKFQEKNPEVKISYSVFCRLKPFHIVEPNVEKRDTTMCSTHENFILVTKKLKNLKIITESSYKEVVKSLTCDDQTEKCLERTCSSCSGNEIKYYDFDENDLISYEKWGTKKFEIVVKGKKKTVQKTIKEVITCTKKELVQEFKNSILKFLQHVANIQHQFKIIKDIKENLKPDEIMVHVDFSENYGCKYHTEVQSAHFGGSKGQLSLHTVVCYVNIEDKVTPLSFCTVSENKRHDPAAICAHMKPISSELLKTVPKPKILHMVSDGPTTQYRNKKMFHMIGKYISDIFNSPELVHWHFQEAGHGKGAPDGVGGTLKRTADRLVAQGADITDLDSFFKNVTKSVEKIKILKIDENEIEKLDKVISENLIPFKGTMKTHQVLYMKNEPTLKMRRLSCLECLGNCRHYGIGEYDPNIQVEKNFKNVKNPESTVNNSAKRKNPIEEIERKIKKIEKPPQQASTTRSGRIRKPVQRFSM